MTWKEVFDACDIPESQRSIMERLLTAQIKYALGDGSVEDDMASPAFRRHAATITMYLPVLKNDEAMMRDFLQIFAKKPEPVES